MRKLIRRLRYLTRRRGFEAELAEEMEFHRALKAQELGAGGGMGNMTLAREEAREVWLAPWLESFWRDLVFGVRMLRRQPGFTLLALLALGSTVGINTSLFTVFNAVALRPWPVKDPSRVVNMFHIVAADAGRNRPAGTAGFSIAESRYLSEHARTLSGVIAMRGAGPLKLDGTPVSFVFHVSGGYFSTLGVGMERGRGFLAEEDRAGAPEAVAVIGHALWQNRMGGDPQIIGRRIRLENVPFTVVGVTPPDFVGTWTDKPLTTDVWIPLASMALLRPNDPSVMPFLTSPDYCCSQMAGRLAPGASRQQAQAEVSLLLKQFSAGASDSRPVLLTGTAMLANPGFKRKATSLLVLMFLAVTLVLLLACANIGNLLLARAAARRQEIAVRLSLGAGRMRLIRQLLVESMTLAVTAAGFGLLTAFWLPGLVVRQLTDSVVPRLAPDWNVLFYTTALAALSCMAFGLAPALHATRGEVAGALKNQARLPSVRLSLRGVLLAAQVAISVMLLAGAGLLLRGVQLARKLDPGFDFRGVRVISMDLPADAYSGPRMGAFTRALTDGLRSVATLPPWGLAGDAPLSNGRTYTSFRMPGEEASHDRMVAFHAVTSGYFDVLRIPVVAGRNLRSEDSGGLVTLINETAAKRYWPNGAVGQILVAGTERREIVGVVRDAATTSLGQVEPTLYWPIEGRWTPVVLVRSGTAATAQKIEAVVKQIEPRAEVKTAPLEQNFESAVQPAVIGAGIAGALGALALLLASVGMSGVFGYAVRQRTREIGIRMALGAQPREVVWLVIGSSLRALGAGLAAGVAGAVGISRLIAHQFYGVDPLDAAAYAAVLLLLAAAATVATAGPARRATRLDAVAALRWD
ncbi:MAG: ADOP family duplicated permease [Acidobacteriia bacterium]|nr:ADOP family duplicated permease [Terriglobia bacterium]